jgi:hypothetical protein
LSEALAAYAGVTLRSVAAALGVAVRGGSVTAEGELDFRGTIAIDKDVPVGAGRVRFDVDTDEGDLATLLRLTERCCVVPQTNADTPNFPLRRPPQATAPAHHSATPGCRFNARVQAAIIRAMDEPAPMPAFTFNPDGPITITYPDGTVSVNTPRPDDGTATTATAPGVSVTATQAGNASGTTFPPESPDPQPGVTSAVPEPDGGVAMPGTGTTASEAAVPADAPGVNEPPDWRVTSADNAAGKSLVNPDGSITTRLPDGSTQTVVRLPGGATIVTNTTPPGAYSQPAPPDSPRSRRLRGRSR